MSRPIGLHSLAVGVPDRILTHGRWSEHQPPRVDRPEADSPADPPLQQCREIENETLAGDHMERLEVRVLAPARRASDVEIRLRGVVSSYVSLAVDEPGIMALIADGDGPARPRRSPAVRESIDRFVDSLESDLAEILAAQNRSSKVDSTVAALSLLGIVHWGICSYRAEGRLSREEAVEQITYLALHGLISAPRTSASDGEGSRPSPSLASTTSDARTPCLHLL